MKKIILSLLAMFAITAGASAMNLKDAFTALSNLPNINVTAPDYNLPVVAEVIHNGQIAAGYNMPQQQILESATAAYAILNQVPMSYMINGGNNKEVAAFIYATPNDSESNDILIAAMNGSKGSIVFLYGTIDDASLNAIQNASLTMQGNYLSIEAQMPDNTDFNITLSKSR